MLTRAQRDQWAEELESDVVCQIAHDAFWQVWRKGDGPILSMRAALRAAVRALPVSEEEV